MKNYALIESGTVTNVIVWDGDTSAWQPPEGAQAIELDEGAVVGIGYTYADGAFIAPPEPPPEPQPIPQSVTPRQARLALLQAGKLAQVDEVIAKLQSPQKEAAKIEWEYSTTVDRKSTLVTILGATLNLDEAALDALFVKASTL